jgi:hypothetical protein
MQPDAFLLRELLLLHVQHSLTLLLTSAFNNCVTAASSHSLSKLVTIWYNSKTVALQEKLTCALQALASYKMQLLLLLLQASVALRSSKQDACMCLCNSVRKAAMLLLLLIIASMRHVLACRCYDLLATTHAPALLYALCLCVSAVHNNCCSHSHTVLLLLCYSSFVLQHCIATSLCL